MALEKTTSVDQITVIEDGTVLFREATRIMEDGNEISKTYHRTSLTPGQNLAGVPDKVKAVANSAWTEDVVNAYAVAQAAAAARREGA